MMACCKANHYSDHAKKQSSKNNNQSCSNWNVNAKWFFKGCVFWSSVSPFYDGYFCILSQISVVMYV